MEFSPPKYLICPSELEKNSLANLIELLCIPWAKLHVTVQPLVTNLHCPWLELKVSIEVRVVR